jgi:hypothetical protein
MTWQSTCSARAFVSNRLGSQPRAHPTPVWLASTARADHSGRFEPGVISRPTADRPWPFTPREYARLLLVRSRVPGAAPACLATRPRAIAE